MTEKEIEQQNVEIEVDSQGDKELDAAGKSLTDALRKSFAILKVIMIVLVVLFITSGIFRVQQHEQALVLRFGKVRGVGESRLLNPGLQWAFPSPIEEIVRIPVKEIQSLDVNFWYFETESEKLAKGSWRRDTLDPLIDNYCLTRNERISDSDEGADYNLVHSKWQVTYRIDEPDLFFKNIYYREPGPGEDFLDITKATVVPLLNAIASDAIISTMVYYTIDEAIVNKSGIALKAMGKLQSKLDRIESGITISNIQSTGAITWPRKIDDAFQASNRAKQGSQQLETEARGYAERVLTETGGYDAEGILEMLKTEGLSKGEKKVLISKLAGTSREQIAHARAYKVRVVETAKANAEYLKKILPKYRAHPKLVLQKIYQDAIEEVLNNADEKILIQGSKDGKRKELRILINRDPSLGRRGILGGSGGQ